MLSEPFLLALDSLITRGVAAGLLGDETFLVLDEITAKQAYDLHLAACRIVTTQAGGGETLLHSLVNLQFPVPSPWCPVYVPPPAPGTYWLQAAWAAGGHLLAHWRPRKGAPWGVWRAAPFARPMALQPGDRWRVPPCSG